MVAPEPHVLLFRRPKNFDQMQAAMAGRSAAPAGKAQAKKVLEEVNGVLEARPCEKLANDFQAIQCGRSLIKRTK